MINSPLLRHHLPPQVIIGYYLGTVDFYRRFTSGIAATLLEPLTMPSKKVRKCSTRQ
jgi:hypothetical protein